MEQDQQSPIGIDPDFLKQLQAMAASMGPSATEELALGGDSAALRICIDRLIPAAKAKDDPHISGAPRCRAKN